MKNTKRLLGVLGLGLFGTLVGDPSYGAVSLSVGVEIRAQSDFYAPLTPYGEWIVIGSYGRCWRPGRMEAGWRPYCNGYWQRTDAGWYWASDEPWGWATYHYGRWGFTDEYGWYWVPQTQWAPAWVSWRRGGGYIGWEPLYMSDVRVSLPRAYVFVEERRFLDPVRPSTMVVNNTTLINETVVNGAPAPAIIEQASGRKIQVLPVKEVRYKAEAPVVAKQKTTTQPATKRAVAALEPAQAQKAGAAPRTPAPLTPTRRVNEGQEAIPTFSRSEPKAAKDPAKPLPRVPAKANGGEKNAKVAGEQGHTQKAGDHQPRAEKPAVPPGAP